MGDARSMQWTHMEGVATVWGKARPGLEGARVLEMAERQKGETLSSLFDTASTHLP